MSEVTNICPCGGRLRWFRKGFWVCRNCHLMFPKSKPYETNKSSPDCQEKHLVAPQLNSSTTTATSRVRMTLKAISQHALDRYMERLGTKKVSRALTTLENIARTAVRIRSGKFYANGWVLKVDNTGTLHTIYRCQNSSDQLAVYNAKLKQQPEQMEMR